MKGALPWSSPTQWRQVPNKTLSPRKWPSSSCTARCATKVTGGLSLHYAISPLRCQSGNEGCVSMRWGAQLLALHLLRTADLLTCSSPTACLPLSTFLYPSALTWPAAPKQPLRWAPSYAAGMFAIEAVIISVFTSAMYDLNTLLAALEIWGAAEGHASTPPFWTNPVAFQDQNSKGPQIPTHLRECPPPDLPYVKYPYQKLRYLAILAGIFQRLSTLIYLCSDCSQLKLKAFEKSHPLS